jgi:hypothetical protein
MTPWPDHDWKKRIPKLVGKSEPWYTHHCPAGVISASFLCTSCLLTFSPPKLTILKDLRKPLELIGKMFPKKGRGWVQEGDSPWHGTYPGPVYQEAN